MSTQQFAVGIGEIFKLVAAHVAAIRVCASHVWLTQHNDRNDYMLKSGDTMPLSSAGITIITAYRPSLLELYRADPVAVRQAAQRHAHRARNDKVGAFFSGIFHRTGGRSI